MRNGVGREHRQEGADKTEGDEDKAENKIDATHQPQPSCQRVGLQLQPRAWRVSRSICPGEGQAQVADR